MKIKLPKYKDLKYTQMLFSMGGIAAVNLLLAFTALMKDIFMASYLGTTGNADAFLLAYFLPDMIANGLMAAAIGTSCVPVFSSLYAAGSFDRFKRLFRNTNIGVILLLAVFSFLLFVFREKIIGLLGFGFNPDVGILSQKLLVFMLPIIFLFPLTAVSVSSLNIYNRFVVPALYPVIFNGVLLLGILYLYVRNIQQHTGVFFLAFFITVSSAGSLIFILYFKYRTIRLFIKTEEIHSAVKIPLKVQFSDMTAVIKIFIPYLLILVTSQSVPFVERNIASQVGEGSIAGLNYAYRLAQFPNWIFTAAISTVILPTISRYRESGLKDDINSVMQKTFHWVLMISVPISILMFGLREPIVAVLFQRGAFDINSSGITANILMGYAPAIIAQSITLIGLRVFLASGRMIIPLFTFVISSTVNIIFDFMFTGSIGLSALGYGASIGAVINTSIILLVLKYQYDFKLKIIGIYCMKIFVACLPMIPILVFADRIRRKLHMVNSFAGQATFVSLAGIFCCVAYLLILLRFKEIGDGNIQKSKNV